MTFTYIIGEPILPTSSDRSPTTAPEATVCCYFAASGMVGFPFSEVSSDCVAGEISQPIYLSQQGTVDTVVQVRVLGQSTTDVGKVEGFARHVSTLPERPPFVRR